MRLKLPFVDWDAVLIPETGINTKVTSTQSTGGDAGQKMTKPRAPLEVLLTVDAFLKVRRKQMNELALKYGRELETRFNKAADAGDLEVVEAFQAEKKNFAVLKKTLATGREDASLPDLDADVSETVVRLRKVWITEKQKIHDKMDEEIQQYLKKLESDLTKTRDFKKAKIILVYRKALLSGLTGAMPENEDSKNTPPVSKRTEEEINSLLIGPKWIFHKGHGSYDFIVFKKNIIELYKTAIKTDGPVIKVKTNIKNGAMQYWHAITNRWIDVEISKSGEEVTLQIFGPNRQSLVPVTYKK